MAKAKTKPRIRSLMPSSGGRPPTRKDSWLTPQKIELMRKDIVSGRLDLKRIQRSDDVQRGLRVMISQTGLITFHADYTIEGQDTQQFVVVGHYPMEDVGDAGQRFIDLARERTRVIQAIGRRGVDVQDGLHARLMREIDEKGEAWKP